MEFGKFKYKVKFYFVDAYKDCPEIWQKLWTNQMVGNDDVDGEVNMPNYILILGFFYCEVISLVMSLQLQ